jgi:hypothetical protein
MAVGCATNARAPHNVLTSATPRRLSRIGFRMVFPFFAVQRLSDRIHATGRGSEVA